MQEIKDLIKDASDKFGVPMDILMSKNREGLTCSCRFYIYRILRDRYKFTFQRISDLMGGNTHVTIRNGILKARHYMETYPAFRLCIEKEFLTDCYKSVIALDEVDALKVKLIIELQARYSSSSTNSYGKLLGYSNDYFFNKSRECEREWRDYISVPKVLKEKYEFIKI